MPACARFPHLWQRVSLLVSAIVLLTLAAVPVIAHEDGAAAPDAADVADENADENADADADDADADDANADDADADDDVEIETTYSVEEGDHLFAIAEEHDIDSWVAIFAVNDEEIDHPDLLLIGQELDIPADPAEVDVDAVELPTDAPEPDAGRQDGSHGTADTAGTAGTAPQPSQSASGTVWDQLAECESNGDWTVNTGNGFYGGLQFHPQTWASHGGHEFAPNAHLASRAEEIAIAERVRASQGWGAWPACSSALGLR